MAEYEETGGQIRNALYGVSHEAQLASTQAGIGALCAAALSEHIFEAGGTSRELGGMARAEVETTVYRNTVTFAAVRSHLSNAKTQLDGVTNSKAGNALYPQIKRVDDLFAGLQSSLTELGNVDEIKAAIEAIGAALTRKYEELKELDQATAAARDQAKSLSDQADTAAANFKI